MDFPYLQLIMIMVGDPRKRQINLAKHGLDFADLTKEFFATAKIAETAADRKLAIGLFNGISIAVVYKPLGTHGPPGTADRTRKCNAGVNFRELSGLRGNHWLPKDVDAYHRNARGNYR